MLGYTGAAVVKEACVRLQASDQYLREGLTKVLARLVRRGDRDGS
ncbi:hypothetical protein ACIA74_38165 [Streptomyces sp. NPDC051658]